MQRLSRHECRAITARRARRAHLLGAETDDPIVWTEAVGANVVDADGNVFVDLTSGFGVALPGHRHPAIVAAAAAQQAKLLHAMGDAFPDTTRIELLERLARVSPPGLSVAILGLSGSDAVDAALKTALLRTGRTGVLAFAGGYHGLMLGVGQLQTYRPAMTAPFAAIGHKDVRQVAFGAPMADVRAALDGVGLVLVEPIQGRGGMREPPTGWLADLAATTRRAGAVLCLDEIQTGCGRTGDRFAAEHEGVSPDLICVGKALAGGFPLSATIGTPEVMDAWGASTGEAIHTQTFLGHPVGCAAAIAFLDLLESGLPIKAREVGARLRIGLELRGFAVRGRGLMLGVSVPNALAASRALLKRGFLVLPAGVQGEVLGLTPPTCITEAQQDAFVEALAECVR